MVYLIPTPIGNIEDISLRSLKILSEMQILLCEDTRVTKKLLNLLSKRFDTDFNIEKFISFHSHNDKKVLENFEADFFDKKIAFLSDAGMPCVSDPGAKLVKFCQENKIEYEVLPGANAVLLAYAASGFDTARFMFYGFLPHKGKERENALNYILGMDVAVIVYESPHRIEKFAEELAKADPDRNIFAIKEATKQFEKKFFTTAKRFVDILKQSNTKGEWSIVIEPVSLCSGEKINEHDILSLDIHPKAKAKLLAKIKGIGTKECYEMLIKDKKIS